MSDEDIFDIDNLDISENDGNTNANSLILEKDQPAPKTSTSKSGRASGRKTAQTSGAIVRESRVPMHVRQPMTAEKRPGFKRRVVNNTPGRIERLKLAGWNVVEDHTKIGDHYSAQATSMGSASSVPVGGGTIGVLMEIPEDLYNEDQAYKHKKIDDDEKQFLLQTTSDVAEGTGETHGSITIN